MNSTCELGDDATRALKPYPAYTDSGVEWLGDVPAHWEVLKLRHVLRRHTERERPDLPLLSVVREQGVILRDTTSTDENHNYIPDDLSNYKVVRAGQFAMNKMKAWQGSYGVSCHDGIVSPAYFVFDVLGLEVDFFHAALRSRAYVPAFTRASDGVRIGQWDLAEARMREIPFLVPPAAEQAAIVRFLDHADRRIRRYVRAKHQLITLLAEKREAATHDALRSAGSRSLRIGSAADRVERLISRRDDQVYTPIGLYNRGRGIFHKPATMGSDLGDSTFFWLAEGDLVLSGQFAWEGAVALAGEEDAGCVASHRYPVLRGKPDLVESAYLLSFFRTGWGQLLLDHHSRGAAGRNRPLNAASLMKERIPVPSLHVQKQIGTLVRREYRLRQALAEQATLLREYRTRLIADVVTGKFDVLEAAARLHDEVEELEPLDEADALIDSEEEPTDALATVP